jgi:hypothetical protein
VGLTATFLGASSLPPLNWMDAHDVAAAVAAAAPPALAQVYVRHPLHPMPRSLHVIQPPLILAQALKP